MTESLYEMSLKVEQINENILSAEGEISPDMETMLDALNLSIIEKTDNIGKWCLNLDFKIDGIQTEIDRLKKRQQVAKNLKDRLKEYMRVCMTIAEKTKIETDTFTVAIQKKPPSVQIDNADNVPATYKTIKTETVIDTRRILVDLKAGKEILGVTYVNNKTHLRIR